MGSKVSERLARCAERVERILRLSHELCGRVIIVTLARPPWVTDSSSFFFPVITELIEQLKIKIVYPRGNSAPATPRMTAEESDAFWSKVKGEAIGREVKHFYSQYEGQSR